MQAYNKEMINSSYFLEAQNLIASFYEDAEVADLGKIKARFLGAVSNYPFNRSSHSIYLVKFGEYYKIGKSKDVSKRIKSFSTVILPLDFQLIFEIPCVNTSLAEKLVHRQWQRNRVKGEWFSFSDKKLAMAQISMISASCLNGTDSDLFTQAENYANLLFYITMITKDRKFINEGSLLKNRTKLEFST